MHINESRKLACRAAMRTLGFDGGDENIDDAMCEGRLQFFLDGEREVAWYYDGPRANAAVYVDTLKACDTMRIIG